jgi:hypothetical protein
MCGGDRRSALFPVEVVLRSFREMFRAIGCEEIEYRLRQWRQALSCSRMATEK